MEEKSPVVSRAMTEGINRVGLTGMAVGSIRTVVTSSIRQFPRWLKLAIVIFEKENGYLETN